MRKIVQASLAFMIMTASPVLTHAAAKAPAKAVSVQKVPDLNYSFPIKNKTKISTNSYAELTDANLDTSDENNILTYVVKIYNGDTKPIALIDYWTVVKSKSTGTTYSAALATEDKNKPRILPKSYQELKFFSYVDKSVKLSDLKIEIVKWDMNAANSDYTRKLGEVSFPKNFTYLINATQFKTINIMDVPIKANVKDYTISAFGDFNAVNVSVQYENVGKVALKAAKTKYYLRTEDGLKYQLNADSNSDLTVQPKEKKTIVLGGNIPSAAKTNNWILQINQDDETAKVSLGLASFKLPQSSSNVVPASQEKMITVADKQVGVEVRYGSVAGNGDRTVNLLVSYVNRDTSTVTLPKYSFELRGSGYSFPLATKDTTITINPMQTKSVSLTTVLPGNISMDNLQLLMSRGIGGSGGTQPSDPPSSDAVNVPVAVFNLGLAASNNANTKIYVDAQSGQYLISLQEIQRLPWSDSDIVSAHFKISNPSVIKSLPVPNFIGNMIIDGVGATETKYIQPDSVMAIAPNTSIDAYVITKIPYTGDYGSIQVALQEKINEEVKDLAMFSDADKPAGFPAVALNDGYQLNTKGKTATVKARKSYVYSGSNSNILYTEIEVQNQETRQSMLSKMVGYFTSGNGDYFNATITQSEQPTQANGKTIITAWAKIPRTVSVSNLKLLVGQGVTDNKLSAPKDEASAYINAVSLELPGSSTDINRTLLNMDFFPYTFSIRSFGASLNKSSTVNVQMDYNLSRDMDYDVEKYEHKLVVEVEDASTAKIFEKELSAGTDLTEGPHTLNYSINDSIFEDKTYGVFTVRVYDLFQGQKRLVGTQSFYYSSETRSAS